MMVLYNSAPVMKLFVWESANCKWKFFLILSYSMYYSVYDLTPLPIFLEGSRCIPCIYRFAPHIQVKSSPFFPLFKVFKKRANMSYVSPVLKPFYYIISQIYMLDFLKSANNVCFVSTYKNKTECKYWYFHSISL